MQRRVRLTRKQEVDIMLGYTQDLTPMVELAEKYGVTRQGVYKVLKRMGVNTSKTQVPVSCTVCGKEILRIKSKIRRQKNHFCSLDCYHAFLEAGNGHPYIGDRNGQRRARRIVLEHFALQPGHIVHHENRDSLDNRILNLRVFANQGDHVRYHRGFDVEPIWNGKYI